MDLWWIYLGTGELESNGMKRAAGS
jgi:hypothetical protein